VQAPVGEGFQLATAGEDEESEDKEPRTRGQQLADCLTWIITVCIRFVNWLLWVPIRLHEVVEECVKRRLDGLEAYMQSKQKALKMSATLYVLRSMAHEEELLPQGFPKPSLLDFVYEPASKKRQMEEEYNQISFTSDEVIQAFSRTKKSFRQPLFVQVLQGHKPLKDALPVLVGQGVLLILCLMAFHCILCSIVFSTSRSVANDPDSGALLDQLEPSLAAAGAASTVKLQPLWDFPALSLQELRQVEDIVFTHDHVSHAMHVATVARTAAGHVVLQSADGSTVRVEPDGRAYWGHQGSGEVFLLAMEQLREMIGGETEGGMNWLTAGSLPSEVLVD